MSLKLLRHTIFTFLAFGLVTVAPVSAGNGYECEGTLPTGTYLGNVSVNDNSCVFEPDVIIEGNFDASNPENIDTTGATIHGNVTVDGATGDVRILAAPIGGETNHIYGNVTVRNSDQIGTLWIGGYVINQVNPTRLEEEFSTLHIHGSLLVKKNNIDAGDLLDFVVIGSVFADTIVDRNVTIGGNDVENAGYESNSILVGGHYTVKDNTAAGQQQFSCNDVDGNFTLKDNHVSRSPQGGGPIGPGNYATSAILGDCEAFGGFSNFREEVIPGRVGGNLVVIGNTVGDLANDFGALATVGITVSGNMTVNNNMAVGTVVTEIPLVANDVKGNLSCKNNDPLPFLPPGAPPNTVGGKDNCSD